MHSLAHATYRNVNIVDHMMGMMEKYTKTLEGIIEERTKQLVEEKKRADELLYMMLPAQVADALKSGTMVEPKGYDCVTMYFSDIVGFTKICAKSRPMEVVNLLNSVYTTFDEIIKRNECYKVETVGDAYVVASGVPTLNGTLHVTKVADVALDIQRVS
jgi:guanylate cyclase 2F